MPTKEETLAALGTLKRIPSTLQELGKISPATPTSHVVKLIESDPSLAAEVLKLVNSSFYGLSHSITNLSQAVVLLGLNNVRNLCLSLSAAKAFASLRKQREFDPQKFWANSLAVGLIAKKIANLLGWEKDESYSAYLIGLMHSMGKAALLGLFPKEYTEMLVRARSARMTQHDLETSFFGMNHGEVNRFICEKWSFPENYRECLANYFEPDRASSYHRMQLNLFIAAFYSNKLGFGGQGSLAEENFHVDYGIFDELGIQQMSIEDLLQASVEKEIKQAKSIVTSLSR
ncbi:MAG: HDOD domain-containing protein [Planctomycetes bacterium]|nr:HDOD domain-containing protein [Planctomycetota bacterium]